MNRFLNLGTFKHRLFLFVLFSYNFSFSQTIDNIDFYSQGKNVVITFDLMNCFSDEKYDISIVFVEKNTNQRIVPKTITGDLKNQVFGNKRVIWEISKDVSTLSGKFYPELSYKIQSNGPTDADGYEYKTVKIGSQVWFAENLRTTKYNDGTPIPNVMNDEQWSKLTTGAWCYYNNDAKYNAKYGKLYNWYGVSPTANGNKNVCPTGWHVPTDVEWVVLTDYLGGKSIAGGKMKEVGNTNWKNSNTRTTNSSGFTGLPGGYRLYSGNYYTIGNSGNWWSSTEFNTESAWDQLLENNYSEAYRYNFNKNLGFSVRCLRDSDFNTQLPKIDNPNNGSNNITDGIIEDFVDEDPEFPGGMNAFYTWISRNIKYPEGLKGGNITAEVLISRDGKINDVRILNSSAPELENEVKNSLLKCPPWKPAKNNGKPVNYRFIIPVKFQFK
jgi:uncharacterized protein (TIGR02145 family)